jgi:hypothetical protein
MQELAEQRGGKCLSAVYANNKTKLDWECSLGHQWAARPFNIKVMGQWCPTCNVHLGELIVRMSLEEVFPGHKFQSTRAVPWMEKLELDGYCEELNFAFEHQGVQHFKRSPFFHREEGAFEAQLERDARKVVLCAQNNVRLLITHYKIPTGELRGHVRGELEQMGYELPPLVLTDSEFLDGVRALGDPSERRQYAKMCAAIERKGGVCLSLSYVGFDTPMKIKCEVGHVFEAAPRAFYQADGRGPRFCPDCSTHRQSDAVLTAKLAEHGYILLGTGTQRSGERTVRTIQAKCPVEDHPAFTKMLSNFKLPTKGCPTCSYARCGKTPAPAAANGLS